MPAVGKLINWRNSSRSTMSAHTRKHPTKHSNHIIRMYHAGAIYQIPKKIADKYRIDNEKPVIAEDVFAAINQKFTKPGALLRGIRIRENLTQVEMARKIRVTQSDISQMENGTRSIGRKIAQRIEKLFDVEYRSFLE
jgi:DNA-binding XRE family transcriptional regulator